MLGGIETRIQVEAIGVGCWVALRTSPVSGEWRTGWRLRSADLLSCPITWPARTPRRGSCWFPYLQYFWIIRHPRLPLSICSAPSDRDLHARARRELPCRSASCSSGTTEPTLLSARGSCVPLLDQVSLNESGLRAETARCLYAACECWLLGVEGYQSWGDPVLQGTGPGWSVGVSSEINRNGFFTKRFH